MSYLRLKQLNLFRRSQFHNLSFQQCRLYTASTIEKKGSKSITKQSSFYLHGISPRRLTKIDPRNLFFSSSEKELKQEVISDYLPNSLPFGFKVMGVTQRPKEGGVIVNYGYEPEMAQDSKEGEVILEKVREHLEKNKINSFFGFVPVKAFPIKGTPFNEDLLLQLPTSLLKVDMQGPDVMMEDLYASFREYGKIASITYHPPEASGFPRYSLIRYFSGYSAAAARVCLHGLKFDGTRIFINYKSRTFFKPIWDWFLSHPRFTIPFLLGTFLGLLYTLFDPLRQFYIKNKISGRFDLENYQYLKWMNLDSIKSVLNYSVCSIKQNKVSGWSGSNDNLEFINNNLKKSPETMILVHGPNGSEKEVLVNISVENRKNVLKIRCTNFMKPHHTNDLTSLAKEFGYFPIFDFLNRMMELIDNMMSATIGKPANFGSSKEKQRENILSCAMQALSDLSTSENQIALRNEKDSKSVPVIIFYDFLNKDTSDDPFWLQLANWSNELVTNHIADVVFISDNPSAQRILSNWVSLSSFKYLGLSDASLDDAMEIVQHRLNTHLPYDLRKSIEPLGGRMSDLNTFIQKVSAGQTPEEAVNDIIISSTTEISKLLFGSLKGTRPSLVSPLVSWTVIKELSCNRNWVGYDQIKASSYFNGTDEDLHALEKAEIITIEHKDDQPSIILPGKPIYLKAFEKICKDQHLEASILSQLHKKQIEKKNNQLLAIEEEIVRLSGVKIETRYSWGSYLIPTNWFRSSGSRCPNQVRDRMEYLLNKLKTIQKELKNSEKILKEATNVLKQKPEIINNLI
ncbi:hypothetical protein K502DRAFT_368806 [Neoconidiobolus thromboides FSU 785]|nr:hypothetical protein K502DRAFT_368806 [Neoconidiobolus thromboides FSU 785]